MGDEQKKVIANWQGRSLKFSRLNSYVYYPWMKILVGEKPVKLYAFIGGAVGGLLVSVFGGIVAYRLTSSVSVLRGILSAFSVMGTTVMASYMLLQPSRNTNLFVDSIKSLSALFFSKLVSGTEIKEVAHDKIYFKDGRIGVMHLVSGTVNPTTLLRHLSYTANINSQLRTSLGKVQRYRFDVVDRVDFNEAKISYREKINDPNASQLSRNIALLQNRHCIEQLSKEVAKKSIEIMVVHKENELQRVYDYYDKAKENALIGGCVQLTGDRLKREVDNL